MKTAVAERIACIGTGVIGRSWAITFARAGYEVAIYDADATRAHAAAAIIQRSLAELQTLGLIEDAAGVAARITVSETLRAAVRDAGYVQESILETIDAKRPLFEALGEAAPETAVLASSTSGIPGSSFMLTARNPSRCLVVHPVNPPHLIPAVEIVGTSETSADIITRARDLMLAAGQKPVVLKREIEGFVINRLQLAVIGEALHLVGEGYCSAREVDYAIKYGLGLRWAFLGVFETGHLNDDAGYLSYVLKFAKLTRPILASLKVNYPWDQSLIESIRNELAEEIPVDCIRDAQAWRDRRLAALRRHLQMAEPLPGP